MQKDHWNASGDPLDQILHEAADHYHEKRYDQAIALLKKAALEYPESPLPPHDLSVVFLNLYKEDISHHDVWDTQTEDEDFFEAAVGAAEEALEKDSQFVPAHNNLAVLFAMRGWWKEAISQWEMSLTLKPDQSGIREELVEARRHLDEA